MILFLIPWLYTGLGIANSAGCRGCAEQFGMKTGIPVFPSNWRQNSSHSEREKKGAVTVGFKLLKSYCHRRWTRHVLGWTILIGLEAGFFHPTSPWAGLEVIIKKKCWCVDNLGSLPLAHFCVLAQNIWWATWECLLLFLYLNIFKFSKCFFNARAWGWGGSAGTK